MTYGWQMEDLKLKSDELENTKNESPEKKVYQEMLFDCSNDKKQRDSVSKPQFKRAIHNFPFSEYKEELEMIIYFGMIISCLDLNLPTPVLETYEESDVINLGKIYMRRNEPNDYPIFRKIVKCQDRIQFRYCAPRTSFLGKTYFLNHDNYYILINSVNGIQDAVTLLHESSHVENYLKYGINLSKYFAELASITREHYGFAAFRTFADSKEVDKQRNISLNRYLMKSIRLYNALLFLLDLHRNPNKCKQIISDFDAFSTTYDVDYLYGILSGNLETEIGYTLSFIASLDIYSHCSPEESNLFITSYQIGNRRVTKKIIDRIVPYIMETLSSYQKKKIV